jgi:uncharacterized protein (UPF0276 family)
MSAGLNLCHENSQELFDQRPNLDFIQIHPEHLLQEQGGTYREHLDILRHHYQVILHGFGLSIGSSGPLDKEYLLLIKNLLKEHPEAVFSDHFSWSSLSKHHFHDLIPLIQSDETVQYMVERIDEAQEAIGAPILLENISSYMRYKESEMSEIQFINEITKRSGCFVLLDVNNIWANAMNFGENPWETLSQINADSIKGYHLAGCTEEQKGNGKVYIDYHGEAVHDEVWDLYKQCLGKYGAWPTLLEWENNIPPLTRTLQEVEKISDCFKTLQEGANS